MYGAPYGSGQPYSHESDNVKQAPAAEAMKHTCSTHQHQ